MEHFHPQDPVTCASFNARIDEVNAHLASRENPHKVTLALLGAEPNKNFLDNWDFRNLVNQRGQISYTAATGYTVDRWQNYHSTEVRVSSGCIRVINTADNAEVSPYAGFRQLIDRPERFAGKTLTLSADVKTISHGGAAPALRLMVDDTLLPGGYVTFPDTAQGGIISLTVTLPQTMTSIWADTISMGKAATWEIYAIKLELGAVSTLSSDTLSSSAAEELNRQVCKRYYRLWMDYNSRSEALKSVGVMRLSTPSTGTTVIGGTTYYYASADL